MDLIISPRHQKRHEEIWGEQKDNLDMNLLCLKNVNQPQTTTFSRGAKII